MRNMVLLAAQEYKQTFCSSRLIFLFGSLIVAYESAFGSLLDLNTATGLSMHPFEPYLVLSARPISALMIPLMFVLLLSDIPSVTSQGSFTVIRTSRVRWFWGQMMAVIAMGFTYLMILLLFSIIVSWQTFDEDVALFSNWSPLMLDINKLYPDIYNQYGGYLLSAETTMQGYPYAVLFHSLMLTLLSIIIQGEMLIVFDLLGHKIVGLISLIALNGLGCSFVAIRHQTMWLLPMAHTIFGLHFLGASSKPIMPLSHSYLYFAVWLIILTCIGLTLAKQTAFHGKSSFLAQH